VGADHRALPALGALAVTSRRARRVVLVAGRDPTAETSGGDSAYVRAQVRTARDAGFAPQLVGLGDGDGTAETRCRISGPRIAAAGHRTYHRRFAPERFAHELGALYESLLAGGPQPGPAPGLRGRPGLAGTPGGLRRG
jgi:hypothetical protein